MKLWELLFEYAATAEMEDAFTRGMYGGWIHRNGKFKGVLRFDEHWTVIQNDPAFFGHPSSWQEAEDQGWVRLYFEPNQSNFSMKGTTQSIKSVWPLVRRLILQSGQINYVFLHADNEHPEFSLPDERIKLIDWMMS